MTYYDYISEQVNAGLWTKTQSVFGRNAQALDLYYRIYLLVLKYEPDKSYGYASRIAANEHIFSQIGGGYSHNLKRQDAPEPQLIRRAVMVMEATFYY